MLSTETQKSKCITISIEFVRLKERQSFDNHQRPVCAAFDKCLLSFHANLVHLHLNFDIGSPFNSKSILLPFIVWISWFINAIGSSKMRRMRIFDWVQIVCRVGMCQMRLVFTLGNTYHYNTHDSLSISLCLSLVFRCLHPYRVLFLSHCIRECARIRSVSHSLSLSFSLFVKLGVKKSKLVDTIIYLVGARI